MKERIQKILAARGLASRRKAEEWILAGKVTCNGTTVLLGDTADPEVDEILVDGRPLPEKSQYVYIMLNKPRGYVTTLSDEKGRPNAASLVSGCGVRVYPVGRLDMDSEGLLIFTNDGEFANSLMHPKHEVKKTYEVWVRGFGPGSLERVSKRIELDGYLIRRPEVKLLWENEGKAKLLVTIHEGRNRQVRRMCQMAGMEVSRLRRIAEGSVKLGDLKSGAWRELTAEELKTLGK